MPPPPLEVCGCSLQCVLATLAGSDADGFFEVNLEDLSVSNGVRLSGVFDRIDHFVGNLVLAGDLNADLWKEVDLVLAAAVELCVALLSAETFHFAYGHAQGAEFGERVLHIG